MSEEQNTHFFSFRYFSNIIYNLKFIEKNKGDFIGDEMGIVGTHYLSGRQ
jgi:hypothetical protein